MTIRLYCERCYNSVKVDITLDQFFDYKTTGGIVQEMFPHLEASQREMLISRTCPACWDEMFGGDVE